MLLGKGNTVINRLDNFFLSFRNLYSNGKIEYTNIQYTNKYILCQVQLCTQKYCGGHKGSLGRGCGILLDSLGKIEGKRRRR